MSRNIVDLRESVFDAIDGLKAGRVSVEQAKAITGLAQVIVNSAKVEADFLANNMSDTRPAFMADAKTIEVTKTIEAPEEYKTPTTTGDKHPGYLGTTVHRMK